MRRDGAPARCPVPGPRSAIGSGPSFGRRAALAAGAGLLGTALAACSPGGGRGGSGGGEEPIVIGYLPPWTDTTVMAFLLKRQLEALGRTVELRTFTHLAVAYTALASGDIDIYPSSWPESLHADYLEEYGEAYEDLGAFNSGAGSFLAVPEHVDLTSIEQLAQVPERFDGRIIGIEPGAGLTDMVRSAVMPAYGLERGFELITSSTPAMLTVLQNAIEDGGDVVVTLWRSFWASRALPIRALEDPSGAFGGPEAMHVMARKGFTADFADAAQHIRRIEFTDAEYESLEGLLIEEFGQGREAEAIEAWVARHPGVLPPVGR